MSHNLDVQLHSPISIDEFKTRFTRALASLTGVVIPPDAVTLSQFIRGIQSTPPPNHVIGQHEASYPIGLKPLGPLLSLGIYCSLDEDWKPIPGPPDYAHPTVPYGLPPETAVFAAAAALALVTDDSPAIADPCGYWGTGTLPLTAADFLQRFITLPGTARRLTAARAALENLYPGG